MIAGAFAKGRVSEFAPTVNWISLAEGWVARLLYNGGVRDMYLKVCHDKSELPLHSHPQRQHVYVISGSLKLTVEGVEHVLQEGDSYIIHADQNHEMKGDTIGDTLVFVVYEPPMMH